MGLKILGAKCALVCNPNFDILSNGGVLFKEGEILEVGDYAKLCDKHPKAKARFYKNALLMPALVNPHIHFEFAGQKQSFAYGSFESWLDSVMSERSQVLKRAQAHGQRAIQEQLLQGVASVGAISSYGLDRNILQESPLRVIFFDELIGASADIAPAFEAFSARHALSQAGKSPKFTPAIAIHAPYSVHKDLAKKVLDTHKSSVVSVHFLESQAELDFLKGRGGYFANFYAKHGLTAPHYASPLEFLDLFKGQNLLLVHAMFATKAHLEHAKNIANPTIITCPRSNRLLSGALLNLKHPSAVGLKTALATDGKSSNNNTLFLEELRTALFAFNTPLLEVLPKILLGATLHASQALGLKGGSLQAGFLADFAVFNFNAKADLQGVLHWLLHAHRVLDLYIQGDLVALGSKRAFKAMSAKL
ncbi:aminofutalosine deaminase family hydrolase [Helicobacter ailurogastricus]|uniref:Adenosine deaminase, alternative form n=1 Tax=Helicobacter ailurogastricus TaxID=1578720 RepID=A0A0K2X382_9HELI|nr:aminofutalosine deaminase family hydrolase [Helicobacter ailurogastricus]CRF41390.1 Adenosine deaminase, alternative form [Helicobacter ailurogastricus]CRF41993.1 Adenosine deaminase, alternative form [Helicobacter ailurogastricus]CRF43641.1 Adenosine deaminase, alternative form [Helicobacter ailurogastricus]